MAFKLVRVHSCLFGARSVVVRWNGDSTIWLFSGITDPASKVRQQKRDPLGRLTQVIEDPNDLNPNGLNYSTTYSYDALDNLTGVVQGVQSRSFVYSSLSRLTSATNPESETTTCIRIAAILRRVRTPEASR
ncbi:MAG: hypothetical protein DMG18_16735 [Acidobacteria bacterium]|nr:MAG: hypothetical protein DMG18_16735 [Acidobacteriota bacterium]